MHLIAPTAAGIRGAENGRVDVFRRGTSTYATYYVDFEATLAVIPTDSLDLDANGRRLLYVDELVDVDCYDSDGVLVLTFTAGDAAPAVEYQGQSFTGQKYDTAASGAGSGYATTVQAVLDRWKDSAGAVDFKANVGGVATDLDDALAAAQPLYFNVKSPAYGAVGDAVTDDTAAINAAITAASVAGGVVFFPAGAYRITSAVTLPASVSMLGAGAGCTALGIDHASADCVIVDNSTRQAIEGISIGALQANSGTLVNVAQTRGLVIRDCQIGTTTANGIGVYVDTGSNQLVVIDNCRFGVGATASAALWVEGAAKRVQAHNCTFVLPTIYNTAAIFGDHIDVTDCVFDGSATTTGTFIYYQAKSTTLDATLKGCQFLATGGGAATAITLGAYTTTSVFSESGSVFGASVTAYSYNSDTGASGAQVQLKTRETRFLQENNTAATYTALVQQYGTIYVNSSRAGNVSVAATGVPPAGAHLSIVIINTDASPRNFTPASPFKAPVKTINPTEFWVLEIAAVTFPAGATLMVGGWTGN